MASAVKTKFPSLKQWVFLFKIHFYQKIFESAYEMKNNLCLF